MQLLISNLRIKIASRTASRRAARAGLFPARSVWGSSTETPPHRNLSIKIVGYRGQTDRQTGWFGSRQSEDKDCRMNLWDSNLACILGQAFRSTDWKELIVSLLRPDSHFVVRARPRSGRSVPRALRFALLLCVSRLEASDHEPGQLAPSLQPRPKQLNCCS